MDCKHPEDSIDVDLHGKHYCLECGDDVPAPYSSLDDPDLIRKARIEKYMEADL